MTCEFCTGTHWLADQEDAGPCVCCTPGALTAAEEGRDAADEAADQAKQEHNEVVAILGDAGDALAAYLTSIGLSPRALKADNPHLDELINLLAD